MDDILQPGAADRTARPRSPHILVVEDDEAIATEIAGDLEARGYHVRRAADGRSAIERALEGPTSLIVLDRMLPALDGISVLERLRAEGVHCPVLFLSALGAVDDRIRGLAAGGDDYLVKPFALGELAARVEALLRRPAPTRDTTVVAGPLTLDLIERRAFRDGAQVELLPREFKLLEYLMRRPDQVVTRAMLLEDVWHYRFVPQTNVVDVHLGKLRRKIDAPGEPSLIESVRGLGFRFRTEG